MVVDGDTVTVVVVARDTGGLSARVTIGVVVPNQAPEVADSIPDVVLDEGDAAVVVLSGYFSDPDGDALTFRATSSEPRLVGVRVAVDSLTIEIHAEGKATVTVTAADSAGLIARQAFEIKQPPTDREILEIFYHATGGAHWANNANWLTDAPLEEWYGITADRAGLVIEIHLFENRLAGPIPSGAWLSDNQGET